ncbi:hypothetical protein BD769DRAFT_1675491 [Suillus cothurnatus]|nr:hypothetical protein BD769DRAFT_1675491 [Suillus cothurnatus]
MSSPANEPQFQTVLGCRHCVKNTAYLTESIMVELESSQDVPAAKSKPWRSKKLKTTQNCFDGLTIEGDLDDEGSDYTTSPSSDTSTLDSDQESDVIKITNEEITHLLPSKMVPEHPNRHNKCKHLAKWSTWTTQAPTNSGVLAAITTVAQDNLIEEDVVPAVLTAKAAKQNLIYYFYDIVQLNAAMKSSLNGLIGHLKTHFPPMYQSYLVMTSHETPLTEDELKLARGEKVIDSDTAAAAYLTQLEQASANLVNAFNKQVNKAFGDWSQEKFEDLLAKWLIACDQPFEEVEKPEFKAL